jgi:hypothetical protein
MADDVAALEKRIESLQNKYKLVIAVAVIFGVSGAWGGKLLSDAQERIAQLQRSANAPRLSRPASKEEVPLAEGPGVIPDQAWVPSSATRFRARPRPVADEV